jgi:hypothetical protein
MKARRVGLRGRGGVVGMVARMAIRPRNEGRYLTADYHSRLDVVVYIKAG